MASYPQNSSAWVGAARRLADTILAVEVAGATAIVEAVDDDAQDDDGIIIRTIRAAWAKAPAVLPATAVATAPQLLGCWWW